MGREIKRVPLDFDWPLHVQWKGYMCPYKGQPCKLCEGTGLNSETKQISDDWYDFAETGRRWCENITQHEVDVLIKEGGLYDFTHKWEKGKGWYPVDPQPEVTAEMVNKWSRSGYGHDSCNQWICVKARAERLGVYGHCKLCGGEGKIWFNDKIKQLDKEWYEKERYGPPIGEGYQLWENVSEGSPISPVFFTKEGFILWLIKEGYSEEAARRFVDHGYAPSLVISDGKLYSDIESSVLK